MAGLSTDRAPIPRFGLIGCGAIGSRLDEDRAEGPSLTHASTLLRSSDARLAAVCDVEPTRLAECVRRRGIEAGFTDYRDMLARIELEGIVLATPPSERLEIIRAALDRDIQLIWCEKPVATSIREAREIERLLVGTDVVFAVNYFRRWSPMMDFLVDLVVEARLGAVQSAVIRYMKGVANNGSHLIDVINALFGLPRSVRAIHRVSDGRDDDDPTLDGVLVYEQDGRDFMVYLLGSDYRFASTLELDFFFEAGRIRVLQSGRAVETYGIGRDLDFPGYQSLVLERRLKDMLALTFERTLAQILSVYRGDEAAPKCTLADGISALVVVDALREAERTGREVLVAR